MRATMPPMIAGSTFVDSSTVRPVSVARPFWIASVARGVERRRRRHFRADDVAVVEQAVAVRREQIRHQHQAIAIGEQRQQLRDDRRELRLRQQVGDGGALARHRHGRVEQDFFEQRVLREEIGELRQLALDLLEIRLLLDGDVEEGAGVADGGGLVRHELVARASARSRVQELAKSFTSSPNLYHSKTIRHKPNSRPHHDLDARHRPRPTVPIRAAIDPGRAQRRLDPVRRARHSTATSRPPEVCGSYRSASRSASTPGSTATPRAKCSWFEPSPPDRFCAAIASTPSKSGTVPGVDRHA